MSEIPILNIEEVKVNYRRMQDERAKEGPMAEVFEARMNRALDEYNERVAKLGSKVTAEAIGHLDFTQLSEETQQVIAEYED